MEEGDNKKTRVRASSDSENAEGKKKKNKITKGVFTRSHLDIQGRPNVTHKEKDKDEDRGSGTYIVRPKNGKKEKHVEDEGHHKRAQSHGLNSSKEDKKKKKSESAKELKSPPEKEKKFKEKLESFLQMKKKKPKDSAQTEIPDNPKRKKKLKRKKPTEVAHKKRTKEKAKSDSEGGSTKKWRPTESFRMRLETEFAELEEEERRKKTKRNAEFHPALEYHNLSKNRYNNVLPNPETRVKLQETDGEGDYINANFVQGERDSYIACQAPLPNTFADFWRMVYEQKVYVIMMLTRLKERDRVKAEQYWPSVGPLGRTRVFVPLRREKMKVVPEEGDTDGGEDELTTMLNHASRNHDTEDGEKEKEKQKSKKKKKPALRDNFYGPGTNGDEEQSQSSGEEADSFEEKLSKDHTLSFETDWGKDDNLEDEDDEGGFTEYGPISVRLQKTLQPSKKFTIRHFYIKHADHKGEIRRVVQIHYTGWPDFGTPKSTRTFHKLLTLMEKYKKESPSESTGPIVLHCSAGLGRTGTLIAAHIALEKLRLGRVTKSDEVDMKSIVAELRDQRHGMVQTKEQYLFLNELVREYSSMSMYV